MLLVSSRRVWRRGYYRIGRGNWGSSKRLWWSWARNGWSSLNWLVVIQKVEWLNFLLHKMIFNKLKVFFIKIKTIKNNRHIYSIMHKIHFEFFMQIYFTFRFIYAIHLAWLLFFSNFCFKAVRDKVFWISSWCSMLLLEFSFVFLRYWTDILR